MKRFNKYFYEASVFLFVAMIAIGGSLIKMGIVSAKSNAQLSAWLATSLLSIAAVCWMATMPISWIRAKNCRGIGSFLFFTSIVARTILLLMSSFSIAWVVGWLYPTSTSILAAQSWHSSRCILGVVAKDEDPVPRCSLLVWLTDSSKIITSSTRIYIRSENHSYIGDLVVYGGDAGSLINNSQWVVYREGSRFVVICSREKIHAAMSDIISGSGGKIPEPIIDDAVKCVENITVHSSFIIRNTQSVYEGWSVDSGIGFELMPGDMIATPLRDAANNTIGIVPMGICIVLNYVLWWFTTRKWWNEQCKQMG